MSYQRNGRRRSVRRGRRSAYPPIRRTTFGSRRLGDISATITRTAATQSAGDKGIINAIYPFNPSGGVANTWSHYAALYDEWQLLSVKITIVNNITQAATGIGRTGNCFFTYDLDDSEFLLSGIEAAMNNPQRFSWSASNDANTPLTHTFRMRPQTDSISWVSTADPIWPGSIKAVGDGFVANALIFQAFLTFRVRFRGRRT